MHRSRLQLLRVVIYMQVKGRCPNRGEGFALANRCPDVSCLDASCPVLMLAVLMLAVLMLAVLMLAVLMLAVLYLS